MIMTISVTAIAHLPQTFPEVPRHVVAVGGLHVTCGVLLAAEAATRPWVCAGEPVSVAVRHVVIISTSTAMCCADALPTAAVAVARRGRVGRRAAMFNDIGRWCRWWRRRSRAGNGLLNLAGLVVPVPADAAGAVEGAPAGDCFRHDELVK